MPITAERQYNLLHEHEIVLHTIREVFVACKQILREQKTADQKLLRIEGQLEILSNPPDTFALLERERYDRNAKENLRQREKQRRRRRADGVKERPLRHLGSYAELLQASQSDFQQLTSQERAQLELLQARKPALAEADYERVGEVTEDDRVHTCLKFFKENASVTRGQFTEFCTTHALNEKIDYFLDDMIERRMIERLENGHYAALRAATEEETTEP